MSRPVLLEKVRPSGCRSFFFFSENKGVCEHWNLNIMITSKLLQKEKYAKGNMI